MTVKQTEKHSQELIIPLIFLLAIFWTGVLAASLTWNIFKTKEDFQSLARNEAIAMLNKDQAFRLWGSSHGGVYAPITEKSPPSPYLDHVKERDITTPSGKELTLLNPAYMIRQLMENYNDLYGTKGHITGLVLLRPENKPDTWEKAALHRFIDNGEQEVSAFTSIDGKPFLRLMRPIYMRKSCEKCHGHLGFRDGDIRGGASVSVPMEEYNLRQDEQNNVLFLSHGSVWLIGILFIGFGSHKVQISLHETFKAETEVRELNHQLEARVKERTNELKEKEQRLRMTVGTAADGIIVIDEDGIIDTFNESAQDIFGYSEKDVLGQDVKLLMPQHHAAHHHEYINNHMRTKEAHAIGTTREVEAVRKDGSFFPLSLAVSKIVTDNRVLFSAICRDLTQEKQIAADLINAKAEAERANLAKSEFLASMSHELRTPLNSIIGFSQLLHFAKDNPLNEKQKTNVTHISSAGQHLLSLINDILDLSRIETQGFSLSIEAVDPKEVLLDCLDLIKTTAEKHNIRIYNDMSLKELPFIQVDHVRFQQILMNLLSNGIKYNISGGHLTLNAHVLDRNLRIEINDTGPGISKDQIPLLFEPFNRLGQEAGEIEGTGIGLSITQKLVEMMQGTIGVESTIGKGSSFWVEFPISDGQQT